MSTQNASTSGQQARGGQDAASAAAGGKSRSAPYRGALFRVEKPKSPAAPQFTGYVQVHDVRYRLAGWVKKSKGGREYLSLALDSEPMPLRTEADEDPFLR